MEGSTLHVQKELLLAKQSRMEGNEGRARVCARRAAGAAAHAYLIRQDPKDLERNAIQSLLELLDHQIPERVRSALNWLVTRVNEEHNLPGNVDLIEEAKVVIQYLNGDEPDEDVTI
jgi:hypothetical protein